MSAPRNGGQVYQVHGSVLIRNALRRIQRRAARQGRGQDVLAALRLMAQRLREAPNAFGEPLYHLPALRMLVRSASIRPVVVHFGVCEDRALVILKGVYLLPK